jgi:Protein of unknown function (DUF2442)
MTCITEARYVKDFIIWIRFSDGVEGQVDFGSQLSGEIFKPLKKPDYFKKFNVDDDAMTLTWPNGADFAPEFLYDLVQRKAKRAA